MKFTDFQNILSPERLNRYVAACGNDTRKAMSLYRLNLHLSQEVFTLLSCFEVALRNAIDRELTTRFGENWLRDGRRITKEVRRYNEDPKNFVWCVSYNPDVADEELPKSMIRGVWKVVKYIADFGW